METVAVKKPWMSKTVWWSVIIAVSAFIPSVHDWVVAHAEIYAGLIVVVNIVLRAVTSGKLEIGE